MQKAYVYVVDRDFGFAPNPFHGFCSLATCKPRIRNSAMIGDWIFGVGGVSLKAVGKCLFAMKVTSKISFNQYWQNPEYKDKKPVRNGSNKMVVGDNIYFHDLEKNIWEQAHSHHSNPDGSLNIYNMNRDTQSKYVLLSKNFYYFGISAPIIPPNILATIGYKNGRNHRVFCSNEANILIKWLENNFSDCLNLVVDDPFNFENSDAHYSAKSNKIIKI